MTRFPCAWLPQVVAPSFPALRGNSFHRAWYFSLLPLLALSGCGAPPASEIELTEFTTPVTVAAHSQDSSHRRMTSTLKQLALQVTAADRLFLPLTPPQSELTEALETLPHDAASSRRCMILVQLAMTEINLGHEAEAISHLLEAERLASNPENNIAPADHVEILYRLGVYHMRLAETENCCLRNSPDSCIIPFQPEAIHTKRDAGEKAIGYFTKALDKTQGRDERSRWLLNIAHMALGEYPDKVSSKHFIDFGIRHFDTYFRGSSPFIIHKTS